MAEQQTINLGIVGIKNMGDYNAQTEYEKLNVVTYQGSSYCALQNTKGNLPTDTDYWQLYAEKGETGETGETGQTGPRGPQGIPGEPSGAPLAASSISDMTDTTKVYVNTTDGKWYYYDGDSWEIGGTYQSTEIGNKKIHYENLDDELKDNLNENYLCKQLTKPTNSGIMLATGLVESHASFNYYEINVNEGEKYFVKTITADRAVVYLFKDSDNNVIDYMPTRSSNLESYFEFVDIPHGATKMYINGNNNGNNLAQCFYIKRNNIQYQDNQYPLKNNYTLGNIDTNGRPQRLNSYANTSTIYNLIPLYLEKGTIVSSAYKFSLYKYSSDGTYQNAISNNYVYDLTITDSAYYRILVENIDNGALCEDYNDDSTISDILANSVNIKKKKLNNRFIHISFDDVYLCLEDLYQNRETYTSIFDNDFLNDLKELHEQYGAVFTLNTFNTYFNSTYDISNTPTKFRREFNNNSNWLKFAFHAEDNNTYYSSDTDAISTSFTKFVNAVYNFAGANAFDKFTRLGFFTGTSSNINQILTNSIIRPMGLFTADDNRLSYYLDQTQTDFINSNLYGYDSSKNLYFIKSQIRLENLSSMDLSYDASHYICEVFTHEYAWDSSIKAKLVTILENANRLYYTHCYFDEVFKLMNVIPE